jgi:hypothetical protein
LQLVFADLHHKTKLVEIKEEIPGVYVALDKYIKEDHDKEWKAWFGC